MISGRSFAAIGSVFLVSALLTGCNWQRQSLNVDGVTLDAPIGWRVLSRHDARLSRDTQILRHQYPLFLGSGSVTLAHTMHGARSLEQLQAMTQTLADTMRRLGSQFGPQHASPKNVQTFQISSAKYKSVCVEYQVRDSLEFLHCSVAETAVDMNFFGAPRVELEARHMLTTLR